jgi:hypothetical protein
VDAFAAAAISALTALLVSVSSIFLTDRQRRRSERRAERTTLNAGYLNPLRLELAENHFRLAGTLRRAAAEGGRSAAMDSVTEPKEVSEKDTAWFSGPGCALITSIYLTACLFARLKQVRDDFPYLRLSGRDDTHLASLILRLQQGYLSGEGVFYVTQPSLGETMRAPGGGRLLTYREFCRLLTDPAERVWFDRLIQFQLDTARGLKADRANRIIADMAALSDFLDRCVGGGSSIMNRWRAEGLELE